MARYVTEFVGTFFLVLTIYLTASSDSATAPLAIGVALTALVYMGGHVSGAHYNPAISVVLWLRGTVPARDLAPYWIAQLAGAAAASDVGFHVSGRYYAPAPGIGVDAWSALGIEVLFTFLLALVILHVATSRKLAGNSFYGVAIGLTVMAGAFAGGDISGGVFNPAVGAGPILVGLFHDDGASMRHLWLYLVGPLSGGALAFVCFRFQERASEEPS